MFEKIISKTTSEGVGVSSPPQAPQPPAPLGNNVGDTSTVSSTSKRNVLGSDVEIQGEVRFEGDLVIGGSVEGRIISEGSLTIGESAQITAEISCGSVTVQGRVDGNIIARDHVAICAQAEVNGDISASSLSMEAGAIFVGSSTIGKVQHTPKIVESPPSGDELQVEMAETSEKAPAA